tara:strand:+ start:257 stop:1447 length:1191 start_codon:yes stop_codon:yes gene_type:complete
MTNQVRLGDIFEFKNGRAFKKTEWSTSGLPIIRIQNLNKAHAPYNYYRGDYDKRIEVNNGDLLFSWSGTVGSSFGPHIWSGGVGVLNQHIFRVSLKDGIEKRYAYYALLDITSEIEKSVSGAVGIVHVTQSNLKNFKIPVPSASEQKRIVAILDEAFDGIDAAIANTEKNLANARELFESYLNGILDKCDQEHPKKRLSDICQFRSGGTPSKKKAEYWDGNIPWVSGRDMKTAYMYDSQLHISESAISESVTRLAPAGALLVLVRGMGLAHGAQVTELMVPCAFNQDIKAILPEPNVVSSYLFFSLKHKINASENTLSAAAHGTLKINSEELKNLLIPLPPLGVQKEIVSKFIDISESTKRLVAVSKLKISALLELKQSLLQKAFSGELTSNPGFN